MKILVVITRMYIFKGTSADEYVEFYNAPPESDSQLAKIRDLNVILVRGYREKFHGTIVEMKARVKADVIEKLKIYGFGQDEEIYILYHPPSGFRLDPEDFYPLRVKVENYSGTGGTLPTSIAKLGLNKLGLNSSELVDLFKKK